MNVKNLVFSYLKIGDTLDSTVDLYDGNIEDTANADSMMQQQFSVFEEVDNLPAVYKIALFGMIGSFL